MDENEAKLRVRASKAKQFMLRIVLSQGVAYQAEVSKLAEVSNVTARQHLEDLVAWGMLERTSAGKFVFYSLTTRGKQTLSEINDSSIIS